jgi:hypothetical protein
MGQVHDALTGDGIMGFDEATPQTLCRPQTMTWLKRLGLRGPSRAPK